MSGPPAACTPVVTRRTTDQQAARGARGGHGPGRLGMGKEGTREDRGLDGPRAAVSGQPGPGGGGGGGDPSPIRPHLFHPNPNPKPMAGAASADRGGPAQRRARGRPHLLGSGATALHSSSCRPPRGCWRRRRRLRPLGSGGRAPRPEVTFPAASARASASASPPPPPGPPPLPRRSRQASSATPAGRRRRRPFTPRPPSPRPALWSPRGASGRHFRMRLGRGSSAPLYGAALPRGPGPAPSQAEGRARPVRRTLPGGVGAGPQPQPRRHSRLRGEPPAGTLPPLRSSWRLYRRNPFGAGAPESSGPRHRDSGLHFGDGLIWRSAPPPSSPRVLQRTRVRVTLLKWHSKNGGGPGLEPAECASKCVQPVAERLPPPRRREIHHGLRG
ncbi:translation initiation factor IF-2-like [Phodopus roborovskii]|uniref:translation initiation factor IF-2-like n=1 Tax=Phodopus roborovskii TaxID=109678 RepID=UPI0021E47447|nr:translation initiation factor IF-2-like [Phodopus roborovskii]